MIRAGTHSSASPRRFDPARVDGPAGEQQVERRGRADQPRQGRACRPHPGTMPSNHFRQAETGAGLVDDHTVSARKRELEPCPRGRSRGISASVGYARRRDARTWSHPRLTMADGTRRVLHGPEFIDVGARV